MIILFGLLSYWKLDSKIYSDICADKVALAKLPEDGVADLGDKKDLTASGWGKEFDSEWFSCMFVIKKTEIFQLTWEFFCST